MPTEARWEKAARGTDGRGYRCGNIWDWEKLQCSHISWGDAGSTAPVGSFPRGASPNRALNMAGNAWEWCADWYDQSYYKTAPARNPPGPEAGGRRVARGGCWVIPAGWVPGRSVGANYFRSQSRRSCSG
jgi:formylglycine-generating enzyme required for sulfatase activity